MVVLICILLVWAVVCGALIKFAENRIEAIEKDVLPRLEELERIVYVALQKTQPPTPVGYINEDLAERVKAQHEALKSPPPKPGTLDFPKGGISYPPDFTDKEGNEYITPLSKLLELINAPKKAEGEYIVPSRGLKSNLPSQDIIDWQNKTLQQIPIARRGFKWPDEYEKSKGSWVFNFDYIGLYKIPVTSNKGATIEHAKNAVGNYGQNNALLFTDALKTYHVSGPNSFDKVVNKKY